MSTTAGLGSGDYVAINGTAIIAILLGVASAIVLFDSKMLLIVPLAGVVCAILAFSPPLSTFIFLSISSPLKRKQPSSTRSSRSVFWLPHVCISSISV